MKSVLYLGCPASERAETERLLATGDMSVVWADNLGYALNELQRREMPVLVDLSRGAAALQVARELRVQRPDVLLFAVVDNRRPELTTEAVLTGVADVFARPPGVRRLATAIEREMRYESRQSARVHQIVGGALYSQAPSMREVVTLVSRAASMRAGVLICGEDGTGRQAVARAIHAAQSGNAAFVTIDCAACDAEQLEAELFGSRRHDQNGRGTPERSNGSSQAGSGERGLECVGRTSRLHDARGGTLYLKNIAEAGARVQVRLGRLLREREATLLETGATLAMDVRPIAGVDQDFAGAVEEGRVREDLFKRLSVIRIEMPPLRDRREDIPALTNYFLREIFAAQRVPPRTVSRSALSLIAALPWRGNAVELRAMLEGVVTRTGSSAKTIGLEDVLAHVRLDGGSVVFSNGGTLREARFRFEREYIGQVLERHQGRISEAAKALGIQRTNLYRKMRSLHVIREKHH